ncbi:COG0637 Predicted phosphatase/phosphohexomutase [Candidatus Nanopelagicaceae bacterium]
MIDTVLFDMDGVLIDATEWHYDALNEALEIFGFEIGRNEHLARFNGMTTRKKLEILSLEQGLPRELHEIISEVKQDRTLRIAARKCFPTAAHLILLSTLKNQGMKVGVVTNSIRMTTEFMLQYSGVAKFLDVLVTNEDVENPKPAPDGYLLAMKKLGSNPANTVVVEDGMHGIQAAKAAGARVVEVRDPGDVSLEILERITGVEQ